MVTATGDLLFVQGLNEPKLPLLVQSETQFMSTATPTGFEFVKDAQGKVTHLIVRADGEQKAVRKADSVPDSESDVASFAIPGWTSLGELMYQCARSCAFGSLSLDL